MPHVMGITQSAFDPASRVRFIQYIARLTQAGWTVTHRPNRPDRHWSSPLRGRVARGVHHRLGRVAMYANRLRDIRDAAACDVVFVNRDLAGRGLWLERKLFKRNPRVVYDFDDAIYLGPNESAVRWMCAQAAWVTVGNEYLAQYVRQHTARVTVIPTVIDTEQYVVPPRRETTGPVRVGWSGSDQSIRATLFPFLPVLARLQKQMDFELVVITNTRPTLPVPEVRWTYFPWSPAAEGRIAELMDIGIMPLVDNDYQKGKCGLKLLQYMAAGLPCIGSPVGVNADIVRPGVTGFLAATDEEWAGALSELIRDADARYRMGQAGRDRCVRQYSLERWLPVLLETFESVRHGVPQGAAEPGGLPRLAHDS